MEAENIMAIAFPSGAEPLLAINNTTTTQAAHSVPPTAPMALTAATAVDHLDHGKQPRPASPLFMMNAILNNQQGATANPLLVNTGHDANTNFFVTPTLATNRQNRQDNRNTVAFKNNIPEVDNQINARLAEIANEGPRLETRATSHLDHHVPARNQLTSHGEHQYQSTYTNQNRSFNNN